MKLLWLPRALIDRDALIDYVAREDPEAAIVQGDRIEAQVDLLLEHLELGRSGRRRGTRELVISRTPYIIDQWGQTRLKMHRDDILETYHHLRINRV